MIYARGGIMSTLRALSKRCRLASYKINEMQAKNNIVAWHHVIKWRQSVTSLRMLRSLIAAKCGTRVTWHHRASNIKQCVAAWRIKAWQA